MKEYTVICFITVVPYIGTWIETMKVKETGTAEHVVPYIGTWIETPQQGVAPLVGLVVPYIGTWIETDEIADAIVKLQSYLI